MTQQLQRLHKQPPAQQTMMRSEYYQMVVYQPTRQHPPTVNLECKDPPCFYCIESLDNKCDPTYCIKLSAWLLALNGMDASNDYLMLISLIVTALVLGAGWRYMSEFSKRAEALTKKLKAVKKESK